MSVLSSKKFVQILCGAGTLIIFSEIVYSFFLKFNPTRRVKKSKKKSKDLLPQETLVSKSCVEKVDEPPATQYRNPWFRHLERTDFRQLPEEMLWNTALFFPEVFPEQDFSQTRQLMWYMQQAKISLKVALFTATFKLLENVLFDLVKKKVRVMAVGNRSRIVNWSRRGVLSREKPKLIRSQFGGGLMVDQMHNKFIVIDDKAIITGSLNWTISAVMENRENLLVTNQPDIVDLYVQEFDRLWKISDPRIPKVLFDEPPKIDWKKRGYTERFGKLD